MKGPEADSDVGATRLTTPVKLVIVLACLALLTVSQTLAGAGDEGFHLLASQLIMNGRRPYLDFFYPQPPVYAYLNAGWMALIGETLRSAHVFSTLLVGGSLVIAARFVAGRLQGRRWQTAGAALAVVLIGFHGLVIAFGTIAQAYALCLLLTVMAFSLTTRAVNESHSKTAALAGLCAGAAAMSSLLSAPTAPILLCWMLLYNRRGSARQKLSFFVAGAALSLAPLLWLAIQAPRQVVFNVVEYHLLYRQVGFPVTAWGEIGKVLSFLKSSQVLILLPLACVAWASLAWRRDANQELRSELLLCGGLFGSLLAFVACARPTFTQYFVLTIPFLAIPATLGACAFGARLSRKRAPWVFLLMLIALYLVSPARWIRRQVGLQTYDEVAREVNRITPKDAWILAYEMVYFGARRLPPPGLEHRAAQRLELPPALAAALHVVSRGDVDAWLKSGRFATVVLHRGDPRRSSMGAYRRVTSIRDIEVWAKAFAGEDARAP